MATYHMTTTGSDANNGTTEALAVATLERLRDVMTADGDIGEVHGGTYNDDSCDLGSSHSGSSGSPKIFQNTAGEDVIFDGTGAASFQPCFYSDFFSSETGIASWITIRKNPAGGSFTIQNYQDTQITFGPDDANQDANSGASAGIVVDGIVADASNGDNVGINIFADENTTGHKVTNCTVSGAVGASSHGIKLSGHRGTGTLFDNNTVHSCEAFGIACSGIATFQQVNTTVSNNTCYSNGEHGISFNEQEDGFIDGNTCYSNGTDGSGSGINLFLSKGISIRRNTCYSNRDSGIDFRSEMASAVAGDVNKIYYNLVYDNNSGEPAEFDTGGITIGNDGSFTAPVELMHNTLVHNWRFNVHVVGTSNVLVKAQGNIGFEGGAGEYSQQTLPTGYANDDIDRNLWHPLDSPADYEMYWDSTSVTTWANWETGFGDGEFHDRNGPSGEADSFTVDPGFVNAGGNNFHLAAGSAAIGSGVSISGEPTDLDGVLITGTPDVGCYQFVPGPSQHVFPVSLRKKRFARRAFRNQEELQL